MARCLAFCVLLTACVTDGLPGPTGQPGPVGPRGPAGERGPAGPTAAAYRPAAWVSCSEAIDVIASSASGLARAADGVEETDLGYTVLVYTNDDVEVQCHASIGSVQAGSGGIYYPAPTRGAMYATCLASADYPSTGRSRRGILVVRARRRRAARAVQGSRQPARSRRLHAHVRRD